MSAPRLNRLTAAGDFEAVLRDGTAKRVGQVILRIRPNQLGRPRFGVIASRKALRRAVDRNRCKRLLREAFRSVEGSLPPVDIVVQFRDQGARQRALTWPEATGIFSELVK